MNHGVQVYHYTGNLMQFTVYRDVEFVKENDSPSEWST